MKQALLALLTLLLLSCASQTPRLDRLEDKLNDTKFQVQLLRHELDSLKRVKSPVWDY